MVDKRYYEKLGGFSYLLGELRKKLGKEHIYTKITKWNTKTGLSNGPETNLYNLARHENLYINNKNVVIK